MALIFISHSSKDNEIVKIYKKKIEEYGFKSVFLDFDDENGIQINEIWEERLYKELNKTNIVICFVSKNWINSCWCQKEYSIAKSLNKEVILLSIEKDSKKQKEVFEWIGKHVQQINIAENPDAFKEVLKQINDLTRKVFDKPYKWDENKNPYPGLCAFTEDMAAVFYGREEETDAIITEMTNPKSLATTHAFLITGASGMGKSSLLRAGVLPKMKIFKEYNRTWHILPVMRPGKDPLNKLLRILINDIFVDTKEAKKYYEQIKSDIKNNKKKSFEKLIDHLLLKYTDKKILLPIDQMEEFFITSNKEEKKIFFDLLSWIFEHYDEFYTIWTIRSDYIEKFQTDSALKTIRKYSYTYLLVPIKEEHITTIIKYPAYKSDIVLEETLIERMRKDVKDTKALPLLAYTLNELTKKFFDNSYKHKERIVTLKDYLSLAKDRDNPIYAIIETKIKEILSHPEKIDTSLNKEKLLKKCKNLFIYHLVDIDIDGKASKKIALKNNLSPLLQKIADSFVQERLLISGSIEKEKYRLTTYEIAHESIIQSWTLLQSWINEEKDFFITRAQVRIALKEWKKSNKNKNALLAGILLEKAQNFIDKPWSEEEKEFILKSIENVKKIDKKRRQFIIGGFLTITSLASFGGYEFLQAKNKNKIKKELEKANYYLGITLVEKAKNAAYNQAIPKAHLFAYTALTKLNKNHNATDSIAKAKYIITNYNDRAISSLIGHKNTVFSIAYSPDGKIIVSGSFDKTIKIWDTKNYKLLATLKGHKGYVLSVVYSPDGKTIASASSDKTIKIWDVKKHKLIATLKGHKKDIGSIAYSPDGKIIVSGSLDKTIKIWDTKNYKLLATLKGHKGYILSVAYSPDGKTIASASSDKTIKIWDVKKHKLIATLKGHKGSVTSVAYSPVDSKIIVSGSADGTIKLWYLKPSHLIITLNELEYHSFTNSVTFSPDGKTIISGSDDNTIKIWDVKTFSLIRILKGHKDAVTSVVYSPDGKIIASGSLDKTIKIWDAKKYKLITTLKGHKNAVTSVVYSPDGKIIASGSSYGNIKIWDGIKYIFLTNLNRYEISTKSLAYSPDSKRIASADFLSIKIWDTKTYNLITTIIPALWNKEDEWINSLAYSPDGKTIVSGSTDNTIKIWDAKKYTLIAILKGHKNWVNSVAYSPNGKTIASGSDDNTIKIWDAKHYLISPLLITLKGHKNSVTSIAYSPDGNKIVSGSLDKTIKIWDAKNYKLLATLKGHMNGVISVAYSPDGKTIASGSRDRTIKIWDAKNYNLIATLKGHENWVNSIAYSPDRKTLISGSSDGAIKVWNLEYIMNKYYNLDNPEYIKQNIKRLEQFLQVKLDGIVLKDAVIPPFDVQKSLQEKK